MQDLSIFKLETKNGISESRGRATSLLAFWEHWGLEKTFKLQMKIAGRWGGRGLGDRGGWEVTARNFPGAYFILICVEWHLPLSCLCGRLLLLF